VLVICFILFCGLIQAIHIDLPEISFDFKVVLLESIGIAQMATLLLSGLYFTRVTGGELGCCNAVSLILRRVLSHFVKGTLNAGWVLAAFDHLRCLGAVLGLILMQDSCICIYFD
jgi:hypothetical protein